MNLVVRRSWKAHRTCRTEYLLKWKGFTDEDNTWNRYGVISRASLGGYEGLERMSEKSQRSANEQVHIDA